MKQLHATKLTSRILAVIAILSATLVGSIASSSKVAALPEGFSSETVFDGLSFPTTVAFSEDGRVFVAEKRGTIQVFDSVNNPNSSEFVDLSDQVYNFWDRGLLGLALHPDFPTVPYVYALFSYDGDIGGTSPKWGTPGIDDDPCPDGAGACPTGARLVRLESGAGTMANTAVSQTVMLEDWCIQFPSHTIGQVGFGPDGMLYVSGGDGASFTSLDWGQFGSTEAGVRTNPCGDPPGGVGVALSPPDAQGGALRSQDSFYGNDPSGLGGTVIRIDPITGQGAPGNPWTESGDDNNKRIVAGGLRNPFRWTFKPGTSQMYVADVGWAQVEEVNQINVGDEPANFGWPCYEGVEREPAYEGAGLDVCGQLYEKENTPQAATPPVLALSHNETPADWCPGGSSSFSGAAFYPPEGSFPQEYDGALFIADYGRGCLLYSPAGADGNPDTQIGLLPFGSIGRVVDLKIGPDYELYVVDILGGTINRLAYLKPEAKLTANPPNGPAPLTVTLSGEESQSRVGESLVFEWDLDGDGEFDDANVSVVEMVLTETTEVAVRVSDSSGSSIDRLTVPVGLPPNATITQPEEGFTYQAGDSVHLTGSAVNADGVTLPDSALSWQTTLFHCDPTGEHCHEHYLTHATGNNLDVVMPDHDWPSYTEVQLTATDANGLIDVETRRIDAQSAAVTVTSSPEGVPLVVGGHGGVGPVTAHVVANSTLTLIAPETAVINGQDMVFDFWDSNKDRVHTLNAPAGDSTYIATYKPVDPPPDGTYTVVGGATTVDGGFQLTSAGHDEKGGVWLDEPVNTSNLDVTFDLEAAGGTGGDGAALVLADVTTGNVIGGGGSGLGASWLVGAMIGFDTYQNPGDPHEGFVFTTDFHMQPDLIRTQESGPVGLHDSNSQVAVHVDDTTLTVTVDGQTVIDGPRPANLPDWVQVGWTGATGAAFDAHTIRAINVTDEIGSL